MIKLVQALQAWGSPAFEAVFKRELAQQVAELPLQQALAGGNYVADAPVTVMINRMDESGEGLRVTAGIFFRSVIGGCSCADDPTPVSEIEEYCEIMLEIDRRSAVAVARLT